jgi:hypothetical protein
MALRAIARGRSVVILQDARALSMNLNGQWIARYTGTNTGTAIVELDDVGDHYEGSACAWDDNPAHPSALIRLRTPSKANSQRIEGVQIQPMTVNGRFMSAEEIAKVESTAGLLFPKTADLEFSFADNRLAMSWSTPVGSTGGCAATAPKTRAGMPSDLEPLHVRTWTQFKKHVNGLERKRYIFRGHRSNEWRLRTSFHRTERASLDRYTLTDVPDLQKALSSIATHAFDLDNQTHYAAFLNLAQHHDYPTPFLDWTWSPYVAAFFAFRGLSRNNGSRNKSKVRIFVFDCSEWGKLIRAERIFPFQPNLSIVDALPFNNPRAIPQQSISTMSNVDDIEEHVKNVESTRKQSYLQAIDLPANLRDEVMEELALMGITAGSLFPGFDGACESLRERNFPSRPDGSHATTTSGPL